MEGRLEERLRVLEENYSKAMTERESLLLRICELEDTVEELQA
jgi:hypothetical protein